MTGMSPEDAEIPSLMVDAWNRRDLDSILAFVDQDVEYFNAPNAVEPGTRRGAEAIADVVRKQWDALAPDGRQEIKATHVRGDDILLEVPLTRSMPGSDARVEVRALLSFAVRAGKVTRMGILGTGTDLGQAREAVGL